jgi:hypothetical protein
LRFASNLARVQRHQNRHESRIRCIGAVTCEVFTIKFDNRHPRFPEKTVMPSPTVVYAHRRGMRSMRGRRHCTIMRNMLQGTRSDPRWLNCFGNLHVNILLACRGSTFHDARRGLALEDRNLNKFTTRIIIPASPGARLSRGGYPGRRTSSYKRHWWRKSTAGGTALIIINPYCAQWDAEREGDIQQWMNRRRPVSEQVRQRDSKVGHRFW